MTKTVSAPKTHIPSDRQGLLQRPLAPAREKTRVSSLGHNFLIRTPFEAIQVATVPIFRALQDYMHRLKSFYNIMYHPQLVITTPNSSSTLKGCLRTLTFKLTTSYKQLDNKTKDVIIYLRMKLMIHTLDLHTNPPSILLFSSLSLSLDFTNIKHK